MYVAYLLVGLVEVFGEDHISADTEEGEGVEERVRERESEGEGVEERVREWRRG